MVLRLIRSLMPTVNTSLWGLVFAGLRTHCNDFVPNKYPSSVVELNKLIQDIRKGCELGLIPMDIILHGKNR
jgi:hypothetical protein